MIAFPCLLICAFFIRRDEGAELLNGNGLRDKFILEHFIDVVNSTKERKLSDSWGKGTSELRCCLVKFSDSYIFLNSVDCKTMLNKKANKITQESTKHSTGNTNNYFYQFIHSKDFRFLMSEMQD